MFKDKAFVVLVVAVTLAFALILWPFFAAIFWATVLAIVFSPLHRRFVRSLQGRRTLAALTTLLVILVIVILPSALITGMLLQEAYQLYGRVQSGEISIGGYLQQMWTALPAWATGLLDRLGFTSLGQVQERITAGLSKSAQFFAGQVLNIGQGTLDFLVTFFIMLYVLFFLLRDGDDLARRMHRAVPLDPDLQLTLADRFTKVTRATIKGTLVVAIVQGALGGLIFWFLGIQAPVLWGVVMAFLSLLPAVGTGLVWLPAAIYLLATGATWQGAVLIAYGILVIGLVDNVLRPLLVGNATKIPDYIVLVSTLGGMAIFGLNGFVIGPVIAAMFIAVWNVVAERRSEP